MRGPYRSALFTAAAGGVASLLACSPAAPDVLGCATSEDCPAISRCVERACVANAPPAAAVAVPADPRTHVLVAFDASASTEPDAGDEIAAFAWAFRALTAPCAPPVAAGTGPVANVRFACPGRYAVDVTATDRLGAAATATAELDVAAYAGPALLSAGLDLALEHVCDASPRCTPAGPVSLSASAPGFAPGQVAFTWSVEPPADRPLASYRRVSFAPSASAAAPDVSIETDGQAISGDWIFRVEGRDGAGVIGIAAVRVSVGNRPPAVTASVPTPPHAFTGSSFTAAGEIPFTVSDPDGDALVERTLEWHHTGDGESTFDGTILEGPPRVVLSIIVPYAAPGDAAHLIGGPGLERTIVFGATDVNGARTVQTWPIVVANAPPYLVDERVSETVNHAFDPAGLAYVAEASIAKWGDPEGDPLFQVPGSDTGDPDCPSFTVGPEGSPGPGSSTVQCRLAYGGAPSVGNFARSHTVTQAVQDPWAPASATSTVTFAIANRPPEITSTAPQVVLSDCASATCCRFVAGEGCVAWQGDLPGGSTVVSGRWSDPDGDPLEALISGEGAVCLDAACAVTLPLDPLPAVCGIATEGLPMSVSDGAAVAQATLPLSRGCAQ